jgi:hypothetical protein
VFLVPAYAVVVAAPAGSEQGCPSPRQVTDALTARIPDVVLPAYQASTPGVLRLVVTGGAPQAAVRVELIDAGGEVRLQRTLAPSERGRAGDCPALAETVALIVDRFLHGLGYEVPPSLPEEAAPRVPEPEVAAARAPPPAAAPARAAAQRFDLLAGGAWRAAGVDDGDFEAMVGLGLERNVGGRRFGATLLGGMASTRVAQNRDASFELRRYPLHLSIYGALPAGPGWLEPGVGLAIEWLFTQVTWLTRDAETVMRASPSVEASFGYRLVLAGSLFLRGGASLDMAIPYQFSERGMSGALFTTPRLSVRTGLQLGISFQ